MRLKILSIQYFYSEFSNPTQLVLAQLDMHNQWICNQALMGLTKRSSSAVSAPSNSVLTFTRYFQDSSNNRWRTTTKKSGPPPFQQLKTLSAFLASRRCLQSGIPRPHAASATSPPPFVTTCWKCETEVRVPVTNFPGSCTKCGRVPKYSVEQIPDYFTLLGQSKHGYKVDLTTLSLNMKRLQRQLHPDLFSNKDAEEQEVSQHLSSLVNQAIVTLQNPIARGLYLLHLRGVSINLEKQQTEDVQFLGEVMELNEELESLASAQQWKEFRSRNEKELKVLEMQLGEAFEKNDLRRAQLILFKMKYYENLQTKLKEVQSKFNVVD